MRLLLLSHTSSPLPCRPPMPQCLYQLSRNACILKHYGSVLHDSAFLLLRSPTPLPPNFPRAVSYPPPLSPTSRSTRSMQQHTVSPILLTTLLPMQQCERRHITPGSTCTPTTAHIRHPKPGCKTKLATIILPAQHQGLYKQTLPAPTLETRTSKVSFYL